MDSRKPIMTVLLLAAIALFVWGVAAVLDTRFESGAAYSAYSSYRSDPMGTRALYESLDGLGGVIVQRNTDELKRLAGTGTLLVIGLSQADFRAMEPAAVEAIETTAGRGGRVVIALAAAEGKRGADGRPDRAGTEGAETKSQKKTGDKKIGLPRGNTPVSRTPVDLRARWHLELRPSSGKDEKAAAVAAGELPPVLEWPAGLAFQATDDGWRPIYEREGAPVIMERRIGKGEIVLASDSALFTNQAMKERRYPALLAWLCGSHGTIVFDETHLGISKTPGIAALLRKGGLTPFFVSLIVLALLVFWRQAVPFVPPSHEDEPEEEVGNDARARERSAMAALLREHIPADRLLAVCSEQWESSFARSAKGLILRNEIDGIIAEEEGRPKRDRRPVEVYCRISTLTTARGRDHGSARTVGARGSDKPISNEEGTWTAR